MDCIKAESDMFKKLISKLLIKAIKRKVGGDIFVDIKDLDFVIGEKDAVANVNLNLKVNKNDLSRFINLLN